MKWMRDSIWTSWTRFGVCSSMQTCSAPLQSPPSYCPQSPEKGNLLVTSVVQELFNFKNYAWWTQSQTHYSTRTSLKDSQKQANLRLGWIECSNSTQVLLLTKHGPLFIFRNTVRYGSVYKAKKNEHGAIQPYKKFGRENIPRSQDSTIMTISRLLEKKWFPHSSSLLTILDTYFFNWTSSLSNQRGLIMFQVECVYVQIVYLTWNHLEENSVFVSTKKTRSTPQWSPIS